VNDVYLLPAVNTAEVDIAPGPLEPAGTVENVSTKDISTVPIAFLLPGESPRSEGMQMDHVARLAEVAEPLPPILVDRRTMQVIDGRHRLLAAVLRGRVTVDVTFFDGSAEDIFLLAVEANARHGLPLSVADRRSAVTRIIASHPQMSDRSIARASGLAAKTVAGIRARSTAGSPQLDTRIGRDGKVRRLNREAGRLRAAELLIEKPEASLREVARYAGVSPGTVLDVRRRLEAGEPPAAPRSSATAGPLSAIDAPAGAPNADGTAGRATDGRGRPAAVDPVSVLEKLSRDPSLRQKEQGRRLLRLLQLNAIGTDVWSELTEVVPAHCGGFVVDLAKRLAETWLEFAKELEKRAKEPEDPSVGEPVAESVESIDR
jgi:ParB-like chromosome segregation protein Spo0J